MTAGERVWLGIAALAVAWWLWDVWRRPFAPCQACRGSRRSRGSRTSAYGRCRWCGGSGERRRTGAAVVHKSMRRK